MRERKVEHTSLQLPDTWICFAGGKAVFFPVDYQTISSVGAAERQTFCFNE